MQKRRRKARARRLPGYRVLCPHCSRPFRVKERAIATLLGQRPLLSPKQRETLDWIIAHTHQGVPPSFNKMAAALGISLATMGRRLEALEKKGYIARIKGVQFSMRVIKEEEFERANNSIDRT